jgi:hypothetical protein
LAAIEERLRHTPTDNDLSKIKIWALGGAATFLAGVVLLAARFIDFS